MSREKQIEEMALSIYNIIPIGLELSAAVATDLYNAGYRKQEWISVDERLPDKFGKYLTYRKSHYVSYVVDILDYDTNQSVRSFFDSDWGDCEVDDVTHWMPLPEAPKMKGGE